MSSPLKILGVIIKSLFKKPACDMYPVKPAKFYDRSRGQIEIDAPKCILCTLCAKKCPTHAIQVNRDKRTWKIDHLRCILCDNCVEVCPPKCLKMANQYMGPKADKDLESFDIPEKKKEDKKSGIE